MTIDAILLSTVITHHVNTSLPDESLIATRPQERAKIAAQISACDDVSRGSYPVSALAAMQQRLPLLNFLIIENGSHKNTRADEISNKLLTR